MKIEAASANDVARAQWNHKIFR